MKLYTRYLFNKTLLGFGAIIAILISLIWFSRAVSFVGYVTENGIELSKFLMLFLLILPWLLLYIIPITLLVAVLLVYNRMTVSNEITILKNSGLTKLKICKPVFLLAFAASIICLILSFYLMPYANKELRISRLNFQDNYANLAFNPQTFETLKELTIYTKKRDENNQLLGILLHDERAADYTITITAQSGKIVAEEGSALLYMDQGTVQKTNHITGKSEILHFDSYVFNLSENQRSQSNPHWKAKERYLHELLNPEEDLGEDEIQKYKVEIHQRFTYPFIPIVFAAIALSCILRGSFSRHGNMQNILIAGAMAAAFLGTSMTISGFLETNLNLAPLLYLNIAVFLAISFVMLTSNNRRFR